MFNRRQFLSEMCLLGAGALMPSWTEASVGSRYSQYAVLDASGKTVVSKDAHVKRHEASLTKLMTLELIAAAMKDEKTPLWHRCKASTLRLV